MNPIQSEPVAVGALARSIVILIAMYIQLSVEQTGALMIVIETVLAWFTRRQVTPVNGGGPKSDQQP